MTLVYHTASYFYMTPCSMMDDCFRSGTATSPLVTVEHRDKLEHCLLHCSTYCRTIRILWLVNLNSFAPQTTIYAFLSHTAYFLRDMRNTSANSRLQLSRKLYFSILLTGNVHYNWIVFLVFTWSCFQHWRVYNCIYIWSIIFVISVSPFVVSDRETVTDCFQVPPWFNKAATWHFTGRIIYSTRQQ